MTTKTNDLQAALKALARAAENSLGSHLRQTEAHALIETMSALADVDQRATELERQRDKLLTRSRELENRANLLAGLSQPDPDLEGQFRASVFILTGSWPGDEGPR